MASIEWSNERARHILLQTDTVVRFAPEYVALVLRLCNSVNIGATSFLLITAFLCERTCCSFLCLRGCSKKNAARCLRETAFFGGILQRNINDLPNFVV